MNRSPEATAVPARRALTAAIDSNGRLGHENLGFLSETHGFMPSSPPLLQLPASHAAWDETAASLPELFRTLTLRRTIDRMPVLVAGDRDLAEAHLLRASAIVSILAHAYFYVEPDPPVALPRSILEPWEEITGRLDRPAPHLSFTDLNLYNWRLVDPGSPGRLEVDNLALLVPILGNEDERRFQMTPVEMLDRFTPIVGAVVRAQEAVAADDPVALQGELVLISDTLRQLTLESFMKVDPNPYSRGYVNPVVWGKTVAPLATPFQPDPPPGPSGTAIPAFQLLDGFFGRRRYATSIGEETARVRHWFPAHWRTFLDATDTVSVGDYVARTRRSGLTGIWREAVEAYAGEGGLLGRHRLKTYGFLDLSFKAGRTKTLAGFGGGIEDRLWDRMDAELDRARLERYPGAPTSCGQARVIRLEPQPDATDPDRSSAWVGHVVLDVAGTGIRYLPGSRLAVLPENDDELVDRTLRALRARGDEPIELNAAWSDAVAERAGYEHARVLPLRTLLACGRIRPVGRLAAKALYAMSGNGTLRRVIEARAEDQWELWDLLDLLAGAGFKPARLWKALPGERESIASLVPPESFRMYSISSAMTAANPGGAEELRLTLGRLQYETKATEVSVGGIRQGTASSFLSRPPEPGSASGPGGTRSVPVKVVHPPRFGLPADPRRPVVMVAGGTGLSPFLGMLAHRVAQPEGGENWLFLATRTRADVYGGDDLHRWVAQGRLQLRTAFSRDHVRARSVLGPEGPSVVLEPGGPRRMAEEMADDDNARELWRLLRTVEDGGAGASFYVCGRSGFATSVTEAIRGIVHRFVEGSEAERLQQATQALFRLVGEGRYLQEVFTTYPGPQLEQRIVHDASEVATHNDDESGYWMTIDGRVYDLTEFAHMHPGGPKIIRSYAGMDATEPYRKVRHDVNPEVDALLPMYEIGRVRRLDFGSAWGVCVTPTGLRFVTLKDVYRAWIELLQTTVELENAVANDFGVRWEPLTYDEVPGAVSSSPYRTRLLLHTHTRFVDEHLENVTGERLERLWTLTSCLDSPHHDAGWMRKRVAAIRTGHQAEVAREHEARIHGRLGELASGAVADGATLAAWCAERVAELEREDRHLLREVKLALLAGVKVFEQRQHQTALLGSDELVAEAGAVPELVSRYLERVASLAGAAEGAPKSSPAGRPRLPV